MGILSGILGKRSIVPDSHWRPVVPTMTTAGVPVTQETAMNYMAVYACVRVLSESVAQLPLVTFRRVGDKARERALNHPLYSLLHDLPNPEITAFEFYEFKMEQLTLWGNFYAEIEFSNSGYPLALWPIPAGRVRPGRDQDGQIFYQVTLPNGQPTNLASWRVWHIRGPNHIGLASASPLRYIKNSVGAGLAADEYGARFFSNDATPGGVLEHPGTLGEEAYGNLESSWNESHGGLSNAHRLAILEEGMKYHPISIAPENAQLLETRKFNLEDVARAFRVPPHMVGDLERATFSNIEHMSIQFVTYTLTPWLTRTEKSITRDLLTQQERSEYYAEYLTNALLRGDLPSRYSAYAVGRQNGWLSANDIRTLENMNPVEGGDVYLVPLNMVPADSLGAPVTVTERAETRASQPQAGIARKTLQERFWANYEDAAGRLIRRETNDILNAARKYLTRRTLDEFYQWLDAFLVDYREVVVQGMTPTMTTHGDMGRDLAIQEISATDYDISGWVARYIQFYADRHIGYTRTRVDDTLQENPTRQLESLEAELERQRDVRPSKIATDESVRLNNGVAVAVFQGLGIMNKRWMAFGDNCPYCSQLNGAIVGIEGWFLPSGQGLDVGTQVPVYVSKTDIGHPPLHQGCDCTILSA